MNTTAVTHSKLSENGNISLENTYAYDRLINLHRQKSVLVYFRRMIDSLGNAKLLHSKRRDIKLLKFLGQVMGQAASAADDLRTDVLITLTVSRIREEHYDDMYDTALKMLNELTDSELQYFLSLSDEDIQIGRAQPVGIESEICIIFTSRLCHLGLLDVNELSDTPDHKLYISDLGRWLLGMLGFSKDNKIV